MTARQSIKSCRAGLRPYQKAASQGWPVVSESKGDRETDGTTRRGKNDHLQKVMSATFARLHRDTTGLE